jgi:hypothetical protein
MGLILTAQNQTKWKIGVKAGWNYSDQLIVNLPESFPKDLDQAINQTTDWLVGLNAGLQNEFQINDFLSLNAGLFFSERGFRTYTTGTNGIKQRIGSVVRYLSLPVCVGMNLTKKFKFELGAETSTLLGHNFIEGGKKISIPAATKNEPFDFGVLGGLTYKFNDIINFSGRYYRGLADVQNIRFTDGNGLPIERNSKVINHGVQVAVIVFPFYAK